MSDVENKIRKHIISVIKYMNIFSSELIRRAPYHDESKLSKPELPMYKKFIPKLERAEYGSKEYKEITSQMGDVLIEHFRKNNHHPEYNEVNGYSYQTLNDPIKSMDLFEIIEMLCDWKASCERGGHSFENSLEINRKKFNLDDQLVWVLRNTSSLLNELKNNKKNG